MRVTTITIKRQNGQIEIVDVTDKFPGGISDRMFAQIKTSTANAGKGECLSYETTDMDNRTAAEKDHDQIIGRAMAVLDAAENDNYSDPARIIKARIALEAAKKTWAEKHPVAAAQAHAAAKKASDERQARIQSSPGYKAAMEGRD